jgi:O-6-methylguanine DNA methyltransferase
MKNQIVELSIATTDGKFTAKYTPEGLAELDFPVGRTKGAGAGSNEIPAQFHRWHRITESALKSVLAGQKPKQLPPLVPTGTEFQKSVWNVMRKIPAGRTKSYGEVAQAIGRPRAVRAVGGACGANPIPILVPCHRILAANKKLGGFSGGLDWKRKLLAREGIVF